MTDPIYVTRPSLPPLEDLLPMLEQMWSSRVLTNNGPFLQQFEQQLSSVFDGSPVSVTANGMLALAAALDAAFAGCGPDAEIITTPYSFIATSHAVRLGSWTPVFVDVDPVFLNIDPAAVERAITPNTAGILAVHCYGNPCDTEALAAIADRHGLPLVYDAAHAFGVRAKGRSLLAHGDFSALSFHATKAFNTFEGGAVVSGAAGGKATIDHYRNFGIDDEVSVSRVGANAKMSEFNAALGLLQLRKFEADRAARRAVDRRYRETLGEIDGIVPLPLPDDVEPNFSYFPVLVGDAFPLSRDALYEAMRARGVFTRRYFYPLLSAQPMYNGLRSANPANLPVATDAADRILCLPIYPELSDTEQARVIEGIMCLSRP